jgi:hypothetical protein
MSGREGQPAGWDVPPWELPGHSRLDCEPHRGPLLRRLANASLLCALASVCPCLCSFGLCCGLDKAAGYPLVTVSVFALVAVALGLPTWVLAGRDLAGMRTGSIDPSGELETRFARERAAQGWLAGLCGLLLWGGGLLVGA